jgi:hypothetical protein
MIQVKRYKSDKTYRKDASMLTQQGWKVVSATSEQPRAGCLRIILTGGLGAIVWKPKPQTIVTYEK